jgi:hypothetical protein
MSDSPISPRAAAPLALALIAAIAACSAAFPLPPAAQGTSTVSVTLWALNGTDLSNPSAYDILRQVPAFTDRTSGFDFAVDMRTDSLNDTTTVLLPRGALGLYVDGGLQLTQQPYDSITLAPTGGYQDSLPVAVAVGTVVLAASRSQTCNFGYVRPWYSKLRITAVDKVARSVTFDILVDPNCGYRSLKADSLPPKR